ncbi:DUF3300 domain-containing protein [Enhydrobacter sp.]|uniref:DUF3300 domain-containing protein n=1 Tax=Enhydrobacter sp. TaxID=1894999 RepID=UPI00261A92B1|nr:DUF3300 domain-containing protein [Enhydrobacter sp.]
MSRTIVEAFVTSLLAALPPDRSESAFNGIRLVHEVERYAAAGERVVHLSEICTTLGVSRRTLHRAFSDALNIGPAAYLRSRHLLAVHRALQGGVQPRATIADIAFEHGFAEPGRFALYHKSMFGQSPSRTRASFRHGGPVGTSVSADDLAQSRDPRAQETSGKFKPEELDQMLAPIALYPDSRLSQVLIAVGYPLEIVEAARWSKANPAVKGEAPVTAVKDKDWDASVKSLVAFPSVLSQMNEHLDWTQKLGDAMISQQQDVADSIQRLRAKAAAAGNLKRTPQQTVSTQGSGDNIEYLVTPADPQVVYVPSYNPSWAYGPWPYPAYPPAYYPVAGALVSGFFWGAGIAAAGALFGGWNWAGPGNSYVNVNVDRAVNIDNRFDRTRIEGNAGASHPQLANRGQIHAPASGRRPNLAQQHQALQNRGVQRPSALSGVNRGQQGQSRDAAWPGADEPSAVAPELPRRRPARRRLP